MNVGGKNTDPSPVPLLSYIIVEKLKQKERGLFRRSSDERRRNRPRSFCGKASTLFHYKNLSIKKWYLFHRSSDERRRNKNHPFVSKASILCYRIFYFYFQMSFISFLYSSFKCLIITSNIVYTNPPAIESFGQSIQQSSTRLPSLSK